MQGQCCSVHMSQTRRVTLCHHATNPKAVQKTLKARRKIASGGDNLLALKRRGRARKRPTPKPLFSFAEVKLKGPSRNPVEFAVEYIKLRLQAELGSGEGAKAVNLNDTWQVFIRERDSQKQFFHLREF